MVLAWHVCAAMASSWQCLLLSSEFHQIWIFSTTFSNHPNTRFHKNPSSRSQLIPYAGHAQSQQSLQTCRRQWTWNQSCLCTCHAQQVVRVIISSPLQCRWILHLCWGQFISIINIQRSVSHLKKTTCQRLRLYTASKWGANVEFVIQAGDPEGSMTITRILNEYGIKIRMASLWPSTQSSSWSLCDRVPLLIIGITSSFIPPNLLL